MPILYYCSILLFINGKKSIKKMIKKYFITNIYYYKQYTVIK